MSVHSFEVEIVKVINFLSHWKRNGKERLEKEMREYRWIFRLSRELNSMASKQTHKIRSIWKMSNYLALLSPITFHIYEQN